MAGQRQFVGLRLSDKPDAVPTASDMSEGELAINTASGRIYVRFGQAIRDITDGYSQGDIDQMLGTAAALNAPESGNAGSEQVVLGSDTRLSDSRTPTAHRHPWRQIEDPPDTATRWPSVSEVSGLVSALSDKLDASARYTDSEAVTAAQDAGVFDPAGSAARAERRIRETIRQQPDPLLMFLL